MSKILRSPRPIVATTVRTGSLAALLAATLIAGPRVAAALPVSAAAGYDYYTDYEFETTQSIHAGVSGGLAGFGLAVTGLHFDNDDIGAGNGLSLELGLPLGPMTRLSASGTRFVGDEIYRAWRIKVGPSFSMPTGQSVGIFYLRDEDNLGGLNTNGALAEATIPLMIGVTARVTAAYAATSEGDHGARGSIGAVWSMFHFVELAADLGYDQNLEIGSSSLLPLSHGSDPESPLLGGLLGSSAEDPPSAVTTQIGIRFKFP